MTDLDLVNRTLGVELTHDAWSTFIKSRAEFLPALMFKVVLHARISDVGIAWECVERNGFHDHYLAVRVGDVVSLGVTNSGSKKSLSWAWPELKGWKKKLESNEALARTWAADDRRLKLKLRAAFKAPVDQSHERQQFIDAIIKSPDDDQLRLVYADWLTERGDPHGELIRLQVDPRAHAPAREKEVLETWWRTFAGELAPWTNANSFVRGFVDDVQLTPQLFRRRGEELFTRYPLRRVRFDAARMTAKQLAHIATAPGIPLIRGLLLENFKGSLEPLAVHFASLCELTFRDCEVDDWARFVSMLDAPRLQALHLNGFARFQTFDEWVEDTSNVSASVVAEMIEAIRELGERSPLERLSISGLDAPGSAFLPLFENTNRLRFRELTLTASDTDPLLQLWARNGTLSELRSLSFGRGATPSVLSEFIDSRCAPKLERLELRAGPWTYAGLDTIYEALLRAPRMHIELPHDNRENHPLRLAVKDRHT